LASDTAQRICTAIRKESSNYLNFRVLLCWLPIPAESSLRMRESDNVVRALDAFPRDIGYTSAESQ
jgi:hypothetical protein